MTERQKRNEVPEENLIQQTEILTRGRFSEDPSDEGFVTTRWLSIDEFQYLDADNVKTKIEELETLITQLKLMIEEGDEEGGDRRQEEA